MSWRSSFVAENSGNFGVDETTRKWRAQKMRSGWRPVQDLSVGLVTGVTGVGASVGDMRPPVPALCASTRSCSKLDAWCPATHCDGKDASTLCICVPAFHLRQAIILVNLRDRRDVRVEEF